MSKLPSRIPTADRLHDLFTRRVALSTPRSWRVFYRPRVTVNLGFSTLFGLPPRSADALELCLENLHAFSCDDWIALARSADAMSPASCDDARKAVSDAITRHQLELTAWFVRDMVHTAASAATLGGAGAIRRNRHQVARARVHAEWAALAIATRSWLSPRDYELLCRPFSKAALPSFRDSTTRVRRRAVPSFVGDRPLRFRAHGD
jgi:hypothetical protein